MVDESMDLPVPGTPLSHKQAGPSANQPRYSLWARIQVHVESSLSLTCKSLVVSSLSRHLRYDLRLATVMIRLGSLDYLTRRGEMR